MTKFLIYQISSVFVIFHLLGCSCTPISQLPNEVEGLKPLWCTELPGKAGAYNDGLIGLPIYDGKILFHSTYFTNIDAEDNRIHALDIENGNIEWTFPAMYNKKNSMFFWGVPYLNNEYLVAKMPKFGNILLNDKLICINLLTQQEVWQKTMPISISYNSNDNVVGKNADFFFLQQSDWNTLIYKGNCQTGDTALLVRVNTGVPENYNRSSSGLQYFETENNNKYLIVGALEEKKNSDDTYAYKTYLYIIDIEKKALSKKLLIQRQDEGQTINDIACAINKVFFVCGRETFCYNPNNESIEWSFYSQESYNYMANHILTNNNIVFLYGDNRYIGLDAQTGKKLYQGEIQCGNASIYNDFVYIIGSDAKLYIIDVNTGKVKVQIICPEKNVTNTGFLTGCKPRVFGNKLYVFGNYHAYCYDAVPKNE
ncbi:MAG: PQQ-binding-like beta-propeller repeat protein [Paludibacter sp.]|nr:PQQ-binding-like beta-propeller repeat protein [Paludibacter sp.]